MIVDIKIELAVKVLLDGGASVDLEDNDGQSSVYLGATDNLPAEILCLLVKRSENLGMAAAGHASATTLHFVVKPECRRLLAVVET